MNWLKTSFTERLQIRYPLIQAPMAGGITTPQLVAAVSNAGGLGSLAAGALDPEEMRAAISAIRELTDKPFAVNLLIPESVTQDTSQIEHAKALLAPYRELLGLSATESSSYSLPTFAEQLAVILEERVAVFSFAFGVPEPEDVAALKEKNIITMGTATHLLEAILLEESGIDVILAQGAEAGGLRGTFLGAPEQGLVGCMTLIPLLGNHIRIPIVAAGGIMDGRGIGAALALGASGVQMGTAFLACPESGAHSKYKELLAEGTEITTVLTRVFAGKLGRSLKNRFISELQSRESELPGYPFQQFLTQAICEAAVEQERPEFMALWAGQGCALCTSGPAAELLEAWFSQVWEILGRG
jgi:nitronate monooxygenase